MKRITDRLAYRQSDGSDDTARDWRCERNAKHARRNGRHSHDGSNNKTDTSDLIDVAEPANGKECAAPAGGGLEGRRRVGGWVGDFDYAAHLGVFHKWVHIPR